MLEFQKRFLNHYFDRTPFRFSFPMNSLSLKTHKFICVALLAFSITCNIALLVFECISYKADVEGILQCLFLILLHSSLLFSIYMDRKKFIKWLVFTEVFIYVFTLMELFVEALSSRGKIANLPEGSILLEIEPKEKKWILLGLHWLINGCFIVPLVSYWYRTKGFYYEQVTALEE